MTAALVWDEARVAKLTELWNAQYSCRNIAILMEISRNSVIGKAHRLELESRSLPPGQKKPRPSRSGQGKYKRRLHTPHARDVFGKLVAPEAFISRADDVVPVPGTDIVALTSKSCRYPYGGDGEPITFCGHDQQPGSSYCPSHHALCWRPRSQVNREQFHLTRIERFRAYKAELVEA